MALILFNKPFGVLCQIGRASWRDRVLVAV